MPLLVQFRDRRPELLEEQKVPRLFRPSRSRWRLLLRTLGRRSSTQRRTGTLRRQEQDTLVPRHRIPTHTLFQLPEQSKVFRLRHWSVYRRREVAEPGGLSAVMVQIRWHGLSSSLSNAAAYCLQLCAAYSSLGSD